jgi:hypothetical protein
MLINLSNHPSRYWDDRQIEAARCYGEMVDIPFPIVASDANSQELQTLTQDCVQKILSLGEINSITVHIMGEMTFTFMVVTKLKELGIRCVASTTERKVTYDSDGVKQTEFQFVMFREY